MCCFLTFEDDVSLPTHINMSENRNMYLSFASLGVVNDLTCLIIIYYVFLGRKRTSPAEAKNVFKDPTSDPILSICQMCFSSILRFLACEANKNYERNHHRKGFIFYLSIYTLHANSLDCKKTPLSHFQYIMLSRKKEKGKRTHRLASHRSQQN